MSKSLEFYTERLEHFKDELKVLEEKIVKVNEEIAYSEKQIKREKGYVLGNKLNELKKSQERIEMNNKCISHNKAKMIEIIKKPYLLSAEENAQIIQLNIIIEELELFENPKYEKEVKQHEEELQAELENFDEELTEIYGKYNSGVL